MLRERAGRPPQAARRALAAALAACVCAVATTSPAFAQAGWTGRLDHLGTAVVDGHCCRASVVSDAAGNATAVWIQSTTPGFPRAVAARYDAATDTWGPSEFLAPDAISLSVQMAIDAAGNVLVLTDRLTGTGAVGLARRYLAATRQWAQATELPILGTLAANRSGDAVVVGHYFGPRAMRYSAAEDAWADAAPIDADFGGIQGVGMDDAGNVVVTGARKVGSTSYVMRASRLARATNAWSSPVDVSPVIPGPPLNEGTMNLPPPPSVLAMNGRGDAVVVWNHGLLFTEGGPVMAARLQGTAWTAPAVLSPSPVSPFVGPVVAIDAAGWATAAWAQNTDNASLAPVTASRAEVGANVWSPPATIGDTIGSGFGMTATTDGIGNAFFTWPVGAGSGTSSVHASRYAAATDTWTALLPPLPGTGGEPAAVALDARGNAVVVWSTYTPPTQDVYATRWLATPSTATVTSVRARSGALEVDLATAGPLTTALEYTIDGGASWTRTAPVSTLHVPAVDDGAFVLQVRAVNEAGPGPASAPLRVRPGTRDRPTNLRVVAVSGRDVTFAWTPPSGLAPTAYVLEGGVAPGQTLGALPIAEADGLATVTLPAGAFYVRLSAITTGGRSAASNEILTTVDVPAPPDPPTNLIGTASGDALTLSWTNPSEDPALGRSRVLQVSGAVSATLPAPPSESFTFAGVPPGTYTFTLATTDGALTSLPSNAVTLTFPGACQTAAAAPSALATRVDGTQVTLTWEPPAGGPAVAAYVVHVTGAYAGALPVGARLLSVAAAPGSYTVRISALTPCGETAMTAPATIVVAP